MNERRKVPYPQKYRMLQVRDCTVSICLNNNPGAVLLSTLLFWYENPWRDDIYEVGQDGELFTCCRIQAAIEKQACGQIDVKTLHDTAVPMLQLLGYLTVTERIGGNLYTLHMKRVFAAYAALGQGEKVLRAFIKESFQLESAPIKMSQAELEASLINKKVLYLQLKRLLIEMRAASNCQRGPKPKNSTQLEEESPDSEIPREMRRDSFGQTEGMSSAPPTSPQEQADDPSYSHRMLHDLPPTESGHPTEPEPPTSTQSAGAGRARQDGQEGQQMAGEDGDKADETDDVEEVQEADLDSDAKPEPLAIRSPQDTDDLFLEEQARYGTHEGWQQAFKAYQATLTPLWHTMDAGARRGRSYPRYRADMVEAWKKRHEEPSKGRPVFLCDPRVVREALAFIGRRVAQDGEVTAEEKRGRAIDRNKDITWWCERHTLEQFRDVFGHFAPGTTCSDPKHQWWREKNRFTSFFTAKHLLDYTPEILVELGRIARPAPPPELADLFGGLETAPTQEPALSPKPRHLLYDETITEEVLIQVGVNRDGTPRSPDGLSAVALREASQANAQRLLTRIRAANGAGGGGGR